MQTAMSPPPSALSHGSSTKPRRLSASSQHTRRTLDLHKYTGKTPSLIASLNSGRASAAPSAAIAGADDAEDNDDEDEDDSGYQNPDLYGGSGGISGRRKGVIFKCETCSKVYRHPNCLIKHRWEHSPHWANSTKVPLSKHQQVQLLEGAAILAYLGNTSSLPEDRAVWPSWTSGGQLPMPTGTRDPAALVYQERTDDMSTAGSVYGADGDDDDALDVVSSIALDDDLDLDLDLDDPGQPSASASVEPSTGLGLRRSLRPRSRSAGALLAMTRTTRSGGVSKAGAGAGAAKSLASGVVGGGVRKKPGLGPVKAGFTPPAHARVTQVAPGVLLAPGEGAAAEGPAALAAPSGPGGSAASAPIAISIPQTRFQPEHHHGHRHGHGHNLSISSIGSVVSNGPLSPVSVSSARSPISASFGLSGLEVLASLSLGQAAGASMSPAAGSHLALSPAPSHSMGSYAYTRPHGAGAAVGSVSGSVSGAASISISSSLPQSSVRSSSGDSDELREVDEDDLDEDHDMQMHTDGRAHGRAHRHGDEWDDGMDFQMDI